MEFTLAPEFTFSSQHPVFSINLWFTFFMSVLADIMIIHQLRETIFMRSLHLISSKVFHTSMDSQKALSSRTEPYALFCTYKSYYHINSSRPKEYRPHDIYFCLLLKTEVISCVNACQRTQRSMSRPRTEMVSIEDRDRCSSCI